MGRSPTSSPPYAWWREPLDAALLDLNLRGESGVAVAEALLARGVPVVVLSGSRRGSPAGPLAGVRRLDKPYRPEVVLRALAAAVAKAA